MSLMKRVSGDNASGTGKSSAEDKGTPARYNAAEVRGVGKSGDLYDIIERLQRRMMLETEGVMNVKDTAVMRQTIDETLAIILQEENIVLPRAMRAHVLEQVISEVLGFGPLEQLLADDETSDIMVIGPDRVYVERHGKIHPTQVRFRDWRHLTGIVDRILAPLGRRVDESSPTVDARLPDGSRINVVVPPIALDGPTLTIRKFSATPLTVEDLIGFGTATPEVFQFLWACVHAGMNMIISGGSSSGKTTLLNVLSGFVDSEERIVTIENAAELRLRQPHVVRLESRPANLEGKGEITIRDLVINALRMRPDRIVVGEVRSSEAIDLLQAMNTGHEGSMGTLHANSALDAFSRLETMVLSAGMDLPIRAIREQMASAINIIVHMGRDREGVRRILLVSEVEGIEMDSIRVSDIFRFERLPGSSRGDLGPTGLVPRCMQRIEDSGIRLDYSIFSASNAVTSGSVKTVVSSTGKSRSQQADTGRPSEEWSWDRTEDTSTAEPPSRQPREAAPPPPEPAPAYESYEPEQPFDAESHPVLPEAQWPQIGGQPTMELADGDAEQAEWASLTEGEQQAWAGEDGYPLEGEEDTSPSTTSKPGKGGLLRRLDGD